MDIRSFFGGGGGAPKDKPTKAPASANKPKEEASPARKQRLSPAKPKQSTSSVTTKKQASKPVASGVGSDSDDDVPVPAGGSKRSRTAALAQLSDSDDEGTQTVPDRKREEPASPVRPSPKRAARAASPAPAKAPPAKPVDASSFFGEAPAKKAPAPAQAKPAAAPKRAEVELASDSSDEDVQLQPAAPAPAAAAATSVAKDAMPAMNFDGYVVPSAKKLCFQGMSFAVTGVFPQLAREDLQQVILTYGGKLATSVSSRTDYLLLGDKLENGDPVAASSKYRAAKEHAVATMDLEAFLNLLSQMPAQEPELPAPKKAPARKKPAAAAASGSAAAGPSAAATPASRKSSGMPAAQRGTTGSRKKDPATDMWVDKYKPTSMDDLVGNKALTDRLRKWLLDWESIHLKKTKPAPPFDSQKQTNPGARAVLLSGPPGIGKTTSAVLVARACGYEVQEMNASDTRSKRSLKETLAEVVGNRAITFFTKGGGASGAPAAARCTTKQLIIMDEVDGMSSGDRGGNQELIRIIKTTKRPIICICNDRSKASIRSLANSCYDLKFMRPTKTSVAKRLALIASREGIPAEINALEHLVDTSGNDIRQTVHMMQMWANSKGRSGASLSYASLRAQEGTSNKDKVLRLNAFDASKALFNDVRTTTFMDRFEQFFVDYDLIPLMVAQCVPMSVQSPKQEAPLSKLTRLADATDSVVVSDMLTKCVRSRGQWGLLPAVGAMNIKAGYHAAGFVSFTGFPEWMGKNSTTNKRRRLLGELSMHLNHHTSGGATALRLHYMDALRAELYAPLLNKQEEGVDDTIALLDEYGLSKMDMTESLEEFSFKGLTPDYLSRVNSKAKAKLTRTYNSTTHRSQALATETAIGGRKRKPAAAESSLAEVADDGVAREAAAADDDDDDDDTPTADVDKFRKKKRASSKGKGKGKAKASSAKRSRK